MKNDIQAKLFGKKSHSGNLFEHFMKVFEKYRDDPEKLREAELQLLKPKPIPKFTGPKVDRRDFMMRSIRVALPSHEDVLKWGEHFRINTYIENNTYDIDFLLFLFKKMDEGRLSWDKEKKCFVLHTTTGRKINI